MTLFRLPDLGEGLQEAEIVQWHVAEGDHVVVDQPLVSVETEKAVVEVPSPQSGHVARLVAREGERIKVGAPLMEFEAGPHADVGAVVGALEKPPSQPEQPPPEEPTGAAVPRAAPAVRARARELGIDLTRVTPSGPGGTILLADLDAGAKAAQATALRGARRTMAVNMARAWREVVHATLHDVADVETWSARENVTVRLIRAVIAGCRAEPSVNASFDSTSLSLRDNSHIDLGLAIDGPDGLFVPVLRDVASTGPDVWRQRIDGAKRAVAERRLTPADMRDPTITLSNYGVLAGRHASLIIMPPQVAILGAGKIAEQAARVGGEITLHRMLPLSLTFDHRAITGGQAARFMRAAIADLERSA